MQEPTKNLNSKEFAEGLLYGELKTLQLPSGFEVTIREQNGHDDDIISNQALAKDLTNLNMFISSLVIDTNLPFAKNRKLDLEGARKLVLRDKYFILFASRVHSIGNIVKFDYDWGQDNGGKQSYSDDLNNFIWDYKKPLPEEDSSEFYEYRLLPYNVNPYDKQEMTLATGKLLRFNLLNGESELYLLNLPPDKQTKNNELLARNLEQYVENRWVKVENFLHFTKKDMIELSNKILLLDKEWKGLTELHNPLDKGNILFPIVAVPDFFYPAEI